MTKVYLHDVAVVNPRGESVPADDDVSFVGMAEIDPATAIARPRETKTFRDVSKGYTIFRDGDILAAKITPCWENGKVGQARLAHRVGVGSTEFHVLRAGVTLDPRYLLHCLRRPSVRLAGELRMTGSAGQRRVPSSFLSNLQIHLPPLAEQQRIVAILDQVNDLHARHCQVLAGIDSLTSSVFRHMFAGVPAETPVADLATFMRTGPFGSQLRHGEFVDAGVAVLGLDNVVDNRFSWGERRFITPAKYKSLTRYTVHSGDVLISIMGTTGRCVVAPDDIPLAINTKHICAITLDGERFDPSFLRAAFLWHPTSVLHLRRHTKGSIMAGLNMGIIKSMPVPAPPLARQREFAALSAQIEARRSTALRALAAHDELFTSLQSRAFRGEL